MDGRTFEVELIEADFDLDSVAAGADAGLPSRDGFEAVLRSASHRARNNLTQRAAGSSASVNRFVDLAIGGGMAEVDIDDFKVDDPTDDAFTSDRRPARDFPDSGSDTAGF